MYGVKTVLTRGFFDENGSGPYILPLVDMLNHSSDPATKCTTLRPQTAPHNAKSSARGQGSAPGSIPQAKATGNSAAAQSGDARKSEDVAYAYSFTMTAERNVAQGEEVMHSYGDALTNSDLLRTFGFTAPDMHSHRLVQIPLCVCVLVGMWV